jgi:dye decolorizing peroxidase
VITGPQDHAEEPTTTDGRGPHVARRRALGWIGASGALGAAGLLGNRLGGEGQTGGRGITRVPPAGPRLAPVSSTVKPGRLPQGLTGRVPAFGELVALDLLPGVRDNKARARKAVVDLLRDIGQVARRATAGPLRDAPAVDGLLPGNLQIAVGFGASLLIATGLEARLPDALHALPRFAGEHLDPRSDGGDLLIQVGAEDPLVLSAALQRLQPVIAKAARVRWSRSGFRATAAGSRHPEATPRNLMGHRDGTDNPVLDSPLWHATVVVNDPSSWMHQGSYLVYRQIRIDLDRWYLRPEAVRDAVIGRRTSDGAALGAEAEQDPVDLDQRTASGSLAIGPHAHIRLANARNTAGARIYRRSWNYDQGWTAGGRRDAGLLFLAWQADPRHGFVPIQQSLESGHDALSGFTDHVASALFAMPGQTSGEDYAGQGLVEG